MVEKTIKIIILTVLALVFFLYWLLPKTRWSRLLKMNETVFMITNSIGSIAALLGLSATFIWPDQIVKAHLMWLIILPIALVHIYWLLIIRVTRASDILDEKQSFNMTSGAATTLYVFLLILLVLFNLEYNQIYILHGIQYFPFYLFVLFLIYHTSTLIYFKRN